MVVDQVGVRTVQDKALEERHSALMEAIAKENQNPFQRAADSLLGGVAQIYRDYLYTSGTLLLAWTWWGLYPRYARFRQKHIMRFRRRSQGEFCRWFFYTRHIPKWDKKYLQRVELPRRMPRGISAEGETPSHANTNLTSSSSLLAVPHDARAPTVMPEHNGMDNCPRNFINVGRTSGASFAGGSRGKMETAIVSGITEINECLQHQLKERRILSREAVDPDTLRNEVKELIKMSGGVVVLKETHETRRSVPVDREVWWVSLEEALRRREWWFWLQILVVARIFEDLLDMPDMPDLVQ